MSRISKWLASRANRAQLFQAIALATYICILHFKLFVDRIPWHLAISIGTAFVLDTFLYRWRKKEWRFPISALITGMSIYLLIRTRHMASPYVIAAIFAVGAKYVFRNPFSHVFNPANIGILTVFAFIPHLAMPAGDQWAAGKELLFFIYGLGFLVCAYAGRAPLALSYFVAIVGMCWLRSLSSDLDVFYLIGPSIGSAGVVFSMHMITDPKTTPSQVGQQVAMGVAIAALEWGLRYCEILYSPFLALAIVSALYSGILWLRAPEPASVLVMS